MKIKCLMLGIFSWDLRFYRRRLMRRVCGSFLRTRVRGDPGGHVGLRFVTRPTGQPPGATELSRSPSLSWPPLGDADHRHRSQRCW